MNDSLTETMGRKMDFFNRNTDGPSLFVTVASILEELGNKAERMVFVGSGEGFFEKPLAMLAEQKGLDVYAVDPNPESYAKGKEILLPPTHAHMSELPEWDHGTVLVMLWPSPENIYEPHTWDAEALMFPHEASIVFFEAHGSSGSPNLRDHLKGSGEHSVPLRSSHVVEVGSGSGFDGMTLVLQTHMAGYEGEPDTPDPKKVAMPKGDHLVILTQTLDMLKATGDPTALMFGITQILPKIQDLMGTT